MSKKYAAIYMFSRSINSMCDNVRLVNSQCTLELIDVFHTDRLLIFTSFSHSKRLIVFIENPMNKIANFHFFCMLTIPVSQSFMVVNTMYLHSSFIEKNPKYWKRSLYFIFLFYFFCWDTSPSSKVSNCDGRAWDLFESQIPMTRRVWTVNLLHTK